MGIPSCLVGTPIPGPAGPAMPDPARLVRKSVLLLKRLGMPEVPALRVILACAVAVEGEYGFDAEWSYQWVEQVRSAAQARLRVLQPSTDNDNGADDADGQGSSSSGREGTA